MAHPPRGISVRASPRRSGFARELPSIRMMLRFRASGRRKRLSAQAGCSLVEQLVTMVLLSVVVGLTLTALETLVRAAPANQEWAHTVADAQAGVYQITRELRQGVNVTLVTPYVASADVVTKAGTLP